MPSPLELLSADPEAAGAPPPSDGVLRSVKAEGERRRAGRRRRNLALAVVALVLLAVPAAVFRPGSGSGAQEVDVAADGGEPVTDTEPSEIGANDVVPDLLPGDAPVPPVDPAAGLVPPPPTLPPESPTTPTSAATTNAVTTTPTAPVATTTSVPATPTTTALVCRNSSDAACGPFRWDPAPSPNQPLLASFTKAPQTAAAGQPVAFEVTWSDGDAPLTFDRLSHDGTGMVKACSMVARYGPWTPPALVPSGGTQSYTTTFAGPGTYTVRVELGTAGCDSPYGDDTAITTTVVVAAATAPAG